MTANGSARRPGPSVQFLVADAGRAENTDTLEAYPTLNGGKIHKFALMLIKCLSLCGRSTF